MSRASQALVTLVAAGCVIAFGYSRATRSYSADRASIAPQATSTVAIIQPPPAAAAPAIQPPPPTTMPESAASGISREVLAKWADDATGEDPKARADAILALADAPTSDAMPVLQRVIERGDPVVDRQLALHSLWLLAREHGDADGQISNMLRVKAYHSDDEELAKGAQNILDEIESGVR